MSLDTEFLLTNIFTSNLHFEKNKLSKSLSFNYCNSQGCNLQSNKISDNTITNIAVTSVVNVNNWKPIKLFIN